MITSLHVNCLPVDNGCSIVFGFTVQGVHQKPQYQIHLKSETGPIYVLLVNKDTDSTSPVVVQVPPPKDEVMDTSQSQNTDPAASVTTQAKKDKTQVYMMMAINERVLLLSEKWFSYVSIFFSLEKEVFESTDSFMLFA